MESPMEVEPLASLLFFKDEVCMHTKVFKVTLLTLMCHQTVWAADCGRDYSSRQNNYAGPDSMPFETGYWEDFYSLDEDGAVSVWGEVDTTPSNIPPPTGTGFETIYRSETSYLGLKPDGSFTVWGRNNDQVANAPTDAGYVAITATGENFAAMKADGSITVWGENQFLIDNAPTDSGYVSLERLGYGTFYAMRADGSFAFWDDQDTSANSITAPTGAGYVQIATTSNGYAALHEDGHIDAWGSDSRGGAGAPMDSGYVAIVTSDDTFTAVRADGSLVSWGEMDDFNTYAPTDGGYVYIVGNDDAYAALKADGSITVWGSSESGGTGGPIEAGFTHIVASDEAFAAMDSDGRVVAWGSQYDGGFGEPEGTGYSRLTASYNGFSVLDANGAIKNWGGNLFDPVNYVDAPTDTGYIDLFTTQNSFAAVKADGSVTVWGRTAQASQNGPTGKAVLEVNGTKVGMERTRCIQDYTVDARDLVRRAIEGESAGITAEALNALEGVSGARPGLEAFYESSLRTATYADYTNPQAIEIQDAIDDAHRILNINTGALESNSGGGGSAGFLWLLLVGPALRRFKK